MSDDKQPALDRPEIEKILSEEEVGCLALSRDAQPYCLPLSYAWLDGRIVIHCAPEGRKMEFIRTNPRCCFTVSRNQDRMQPHRAQGKCSYRFESVIVTGKARIVESAEERLRLLTSFKVFFYRKLGMDPAQDPLTIDAANHCGCIVIEPESMAGRRKG